MKDIDESPILSYRKTSGFGSCKDFAVVGTQGWVRRVPIWTVDMGEAQVAKAGIEDGLPLNRTAEVGQSCGREFRW